MSLGILVLTTAMATNAGARWTDYATVQLVDEIKTDSNTRRENVNGADEYTLDLWNGRQRIYLIYKDRKRNQRLGTVGSEDSLHLYYDNGERIIAFDDTGLNGIRIEDTGDNYVVNGIPQQLHTGSKVSRANADCAETKEYVRGILRARKQSFAKR